MEKIRIIDSHTGGEPTRVVVSSSIRLDAATMLGRSRQFSSQFDHYRRAIVCEPRGSDIIVGALLTDPVSDGSTAGVIFFNNVGTLGMCGHGLMGVAVALQYLQKIDTGEFAIDTPVGTVSFQLQPGNRVQIQNIPSYRWRKSVPVQIFPGTAHARTVHGDIAWGGNWFFICEDHGLPVTFDQIHQLDLTSREIRYQLDSLGITGESNQVIDHVELIESHSSDQASLSRGFVLCPGAAYDRSPCGTGTSAKLACLAADGKLAPGQPHVQQSIVGSQFVGTYQMAAEQLPGGAPRILPTLTGTAFVNGDYQLILDEADPFCWGLVPA